MLVLILRVQQYCHTLHNWRAWKFSKIKDERRWKLTIIHSNVQTINNNYLALELLTKDTNCDVLCLFETWVNDLQINIFKIFENFDSATFSNRQHTAHVDVAIFVRSDIKYKERADLNSISA